MAEGGIFPWKTNINDEPVIDIENFTKPLPPPPKGFEWIVKEDKTWELKEIVPVIVEENKLEPVVDTLAPINGCIEHIILQQDTLTGISLKYGVSAAKIRRANNFSGDNIRMMVKLKIPVSGEVTVAPPTPQEIEESIMLSFCKITKEGKNEAKIYLEDAHYDLDRALAMWREDQDWVDTKELGEKAKLIKKEKLMGN